MGKHRHLGVVLAAGAWAACMAIPCGAQGSSSSSGQASPDAGPAPCAVAPQPQPCGTSPTPANKPSAGEKFPFPGTAGAIGPSTGSESSSPSLSGVPQSPDGGSNSAPAAKPDASKQFPFPGDAGVPRSPDAGSSSSSSSGSSGEDAPADSGGAPALTDKGSEGSAGSATPGRHLLHRVNPVGTKLQTIDEREQEDLDVAHFYVEQGDLQGAYMRSQDAIKIAPDDPDAHFALAEIALKLNKKDEAIAEYSACLKLDPTDKEAKDARKALARLK